MLIRPLTSELQKMSEDELNEDSTRIEKDFDHIKEWLGKQPHLKIRTEDQWLIGFLRGCKFSLEQTKGKLDFFYTMRSLIPELFADRNPFSPEIQAVLKANAVIPLSKTKDAVSPRVILLRWEDCDPEKISLVTFIKVLFMIIDILINEDDNFVISGMYMWVELKNCPLSYMLQYTPSFLKKIVLCLQRAYPIRIKAIHCTTVPSAFEVVYNIAKTFMAAKLRERVNLFSAEKLNKVYEDISIPVLPKSYGGDGGPIDEIGAEWKKKVESYNEWFLEDAQYYSNEKLRVAPTESSGELFGTDGSFRKLDFD